MTSRKFIVAFVISFLVYLLPEILVSDVMLYITGGLFLATIDQMLKLFSVQNSNISFLLWAFILIGTIILFFRLKNKAFKYFILFVIGLLLYIIDFGLLGLVSYDPEMKDRIILNSNIKATTFMLIGVLIKSLVLSWVYYKGSKEINKATH